MSHLPTQTHRVSFLRRYWKPVAVTGAGGTVAAIWFDEILLFGEEILALIFLPLLAGAIYLFDTYIFQSRLPRRDDMNNHNNKENRK
jgi:hypothetical protein